MWTLSCGRTHRRPQVESAESTKTRKTLSNSVQARYWKPELTTDTEIKEMGSGSPRKIELGACGNEIKELASEEVATEITAERLRLRRGNLVFESTALLIELPP